MRINVNIPPEEISKVLQLMNNANTETDGEAEIDYEAMADRIFNALLDKEILYNKLHEKYALLQQSMTGLMGAVAAANGGKVLISKEMMTYFSSTGADNVHASLDSEGNMVVETYDKQE